MGASAARSDLRAGLENASWAEYAPLLPIYPRNRTSDPRSRRYPDAMLDQRAIARVQRHTEIHNVPYSI